MQTLNKKHAKLCAVSETMHDVYGFWVLLWKSHMANVKNIFVELDVDFVLFVDFAISNCLSNLKPLFMIQKKAVRMINYAHPLEQGFPTFIVPRTGRYIKKKIADRLSILIFTVYVTA